MRSPRLVLAALALLGCGSDPTSPPLAKAPDVFIVSGAAGLGANAYDPNNLTFSLAAKQSVKWGNNDGVAHTVTANGGAFDSGSIADGGTFSFTFTTPGTYPYHCSIHPTMVGTITVNP
jgi:plastocyanin